MAKCPHCKETVVLSETTSPRPHSQVVRKEIVGTIKKEIMYSCPHCDCVLGFGYFFGGVLTGRPK